MTDTNGATSRAAWQALRAGMTARDTDALESLLTDGFTLTHMTGNVQPKTDWLHDIDTGSMRYHSIKDVESVEGMEDRDAALTVRTFTDATIWGSRHTWRLQLRLRVTADGRIAGTVATTW